MNSNLRNLRRKLEGWRSENAGVAEAAAKINLERMRVLAPVIALVNALHAVVFFFQRMDTEPGSPAYRWALGLSLIHFGMGCTMASCAYLTHRLRYASRSAWGVWLPLIMVALALVFTILVVTVDQLVTPNITPFLMTCTIASLAIYLRPMASLWMFLAAFTAFYFALGVTQADAAQLLSNRLNGIVACVMGWSLSVLLWRNFTTIRMQHGQLEKANADLQLKQRQLERLTRLDGLTGLYNRNTFVELARQELERAQRHGTDTTILLMDLDYFKKVNDTWGHPAGDAVLRHVAAQANATVRSTDLVGRLGGEEFIVLLPGTSVIAARKIAEKLRSTLEANATTWEQAAIPTTVSIGIAGTSAAEKRSFDSLYSEADKCLYLAKQRGRNRVI